MARLYNRVGEQTSTTGTGTVTLAGDIDESYATFAEAGVQNDEVVSYLITEGDDFEIGRGTYTSAGTTLSRDTVLLSKIGGTAGTTKMTLAGAAEVRISMAAQDLQTFIDMVSGGVIGFNNNALTVTHSTNTLTMAANADAILAFVLNNAHASGESRVRAEVGSNYIYLHCTGDSDFDELIASDHLTVRAGDSGSNGNITFTAGTSQGVTFESQTSQTNIAVDLFEIKQNSTGTTAPGFGVSIKCRLENSSGNNFDAAYLTFEATNVTDALEDVDFIVRLGAAGNDPAERFRVKNDGRYVTQGGHDEKVVTLTDGATPALNAALGNVFHLTAAGNRTIAVPSNAPGSGRTQKIIIRHEASGAARTLALNTGAGGFRFGTDITALTETGSGLTDYIGCVWNQAADRWDVVSYCKGF